MTKKFCLTGPPAPDNVRVVSTTSITATVTWEMVSVSRDNVQQYQLQYRAPGDAGQFTHLSVITLSASFDVFSLFYLRLQLCYDVHMLLSD